jgi:hypothetical protein
VLPSAAARPPTAGARPAPRGGLHHALAADPRPAPRAAPTPARRLPPAHGAGDKAGQAKWRRAKRREKLLPPNC